LSSNKIMELINAVLMFLENTFERYTITFNARVFLLVVLVVLNQFTRIRALWTVYIVFTTMLYAQSFVGAYILKPLFNLISIDHSDESVDAFIYKYNVIVTVTAYIEVLLLIIAVYRVVAANRMLPSNKNRAIKVKSQSPQAPPHYAVSATPATTSITGNNNWNVGTLHGNVYIGASSNQDSDDPTEDETRDLVN